ncbi:MAG: 50S ribosomal protein L9 [Firmicutes bacterium]|nr:50S ribosomal protein L9 [Bacillota bacterium]
MQVYLLKDLPGKGKAGEIINVNDGYGKNFVIKNKIGQVVTPEILAKVKSKNESDAFHTEQDKARIREIIAKLEGTIVTLTAKIGEGGKMFGSITSTEITKELADQGFEIDKKNIILPEPIKTLGEYKIRVKYNYGLEGSFTVIVNQ